MEEDNIERKQNEKGSFIKGFLLGIGASFLNGILSNLIFFIFIILKHPKSGMPNVNFFDVNLYFSYLDIILLFSGAFIWIPISIIAGFIAKKKGIRRCIIFLAICISIILLSFGTCNGVIL